MTPRPGKLFRPSLLELEDRAVPAWWTVTAPTLPEGVAGVTDATHAGTLGLNPNHSPANGAVTVWADSAAGAVAEGLVGGIEVTLGDQVFFQSFGPATVGGAADGMSFRVSVSSTGAATTEFEDMVGFPGATADMDYDDRSFPGVTVQSTGDPVVEIGNWDLVSPKTKETVSVEMKVTREKPNEYFWEYEVRNNNLSNQYPNIPGVMGFSVVAPDDVSVSGMTASLSGWTPSHSGGLAAWFAPWPGGNYLTMGNTAVFTFRTPVVPIVSAAGMATAAPIPVEEGEDTPGQVLPGGIHPVGAIRGPKDEPPVTIEYRQEGTTGDLSQDNPSGQNAQGQPDGTPAFKGGWRLFPDAKEYDTRSTARNVVRVRATTVPNVDVSFWPFDVDDPSADVTIDANDDGLDNRGTGGGDAKTPTAAGVGAGYQGRLRAAEVGKPGAGAFLAPGRIVTVRSDANGVAEVDLATSFNPGDNFRVVASLSQARLAALNDTTSVPTTGPLPDRPGVDGGPPLPSREKATDQLSVWRRLHVEKDRMRSTPWTDPPKPISITGAVQGGADTIVVTVAPGQLGALDFHGANLRDSRHNHFHVIRVDPDDTNKLVVIPALGGTPLPVNGDAVLSQGDIQSGRVEGVEAPALGRVKVTVRTPIGARREYDGGVLRVGQTNYNIYTNEKHTDGLSVVDVISDVALDNIVNSTATIYQDDFTTTGRVSGSYGAGFAASVGAPVNGQVEVRTTAFSRAGAGQYVGGYVFDKKTGARYPVTANTAGPNAVFTITANAAPALAQGDLVTVWIAPGPNAPVAATNLYDAGMYDQMASNTVRAQNRFADAYVQPDYTTLWRFNSNNVVPITHVSTDTKGLHSLDIDKYRGQQPGGPARDADFETPVFWSAYVLAGYEAEPKSDYDSGAESSVFGITFADLPNYQISVVFLETIRDMLSEPTTLTDPGFSMSEWQIRARTTAHEVGHQLLGDEFAAGVPGISPSNHRDNPRNIMTSGSSFVVADANFFFHGHEVDRVRDIVTNH